MEKDILNKLHELAKELSVTDEYIHRKKLLEEEKEKFLKIVGEEQRQNLEKVTDAVHYANDEINRQHFCEGCSVAVRFLTKCIYNKKRDDQE